VKSSRYFTGLLSVFQRFSVSAFDLLISLAREVFSLLHRAASPGRFPNFCFQKFRGYGET
jgi:hypothetical protein